jgi:preprotein translocase subunit SecG
MLELFETPTTVLHILVCLFLIFVILIQPGKSGGLGAALGGAGAQQVFGGRGAGTFLSKVTWICAVTFFVTSMTLAYLSSSGDDTLRDRAVEQAEAAQQVEAELERDMNGEPSPAPMPASEAAPAEAPAQPNPEPAPAPNP